MREKAGQGDLVATTHKSFRLIACSELREILGKKAEDERRLVELLEEVPLDSIYFHTHSYFLRHSYVERVYPNDFAQWVAMEVRDHLLAERLAVVDPFAFSNLEALREELISVIDDHLSRTAIVPRVIFGSPFHFGQSRVLEVPTGLEVTTLEEFHHAIAEVEVSAIYFHVFEARHRLGSSENDFSTWALRSLGMPEFAQRLQSMNPYQGSLERLRSSLVAACDEFIAASPAGRDTKEEPSRP